MIYTSSLNVPVRKALGTLVMQSNLNKICDQLVLDPDTTNMDVVILGPKDVIGPKATKVQRALERAHPDICVLYIYEKDADRDLIDVEYKSQCKKIKPDAIKEAFETYVGEHKVRQGKQQLSSADFDEAPSAIAEHSLFRKKKSRKTDQRSKLLHKDVDLDDEDDFYDDFDDGEDTEPAPLPMPEDPIGMDDDLPEDLPGDDEEGDFDVPEFEFSAEEPGEFDVPEEPTPLDTAPEEPPVFETPETPAPEPIASIEESIAKIHNFEDWSLMVEHLNKDSIVKNLIQDNSEYAGLVTMLDVLDKRIDAVWRDVALSPDQKFEKIKEIGLEKSVVRASSNSMQVEKVISIISTIVLSAKRTVEEKVQSLDVALYKVATDKAQIMDTTYIDRAIEERTKVQLELLNISRSIVDLYKSIDALVTEEINDLDKRLPSANQFINSMVKPIGTQIFTPTNTAALTNRLMRALQENSVVASQMEETVNAVIDNLFALCEKDEEIIRYQQNMINLLKANRVEDVIITNTLLKKSLRLYTGSDNSGRSATAITWCGILSRRHNSLLIDLTGRAKFSDYGIDAMSLDDFLNSRPELQFLCVESNKQLDPEELQHLVDDLKGRLNYYPYVNIIVAPEDTNAINQLSEEAITIHYITNCTSQSLKQMHDVIAANKTQNVARRLVTIDTPVSPITIADNLGVDVSITKICTLPAVPAIRACALRHDRPYEYNDVVKVFEEAFK